MRIKDKIDAYGTMFFKYNIDGVELDVQINHWNMFSLSIGSLNIVSLPVLIEHYNEHVYLDIIDHNKIPNVSILNLKIYYEIMKDLEEQDVIDFVLQNEENNKR